MMFIAYPLRFGVDSLKSLESLKMWMFCRFQPPRCQCKPANGLESIPTTTRRPV